MAYRFAIQYANRGHAVGVLTTHRQGEKIKHFTSAGLEVFSLSTSYPKLLRQYLSLFNPSVNAAVLEALKAFRPDIVHAHNIHRYLSYQSLRQCRKAGIPVVITLHDAMSVDYGRFVQAYHNKPTNIDEEPDYRVKLIPTLTRYHLHYLPFRNAFIRHILMNFADARCAPSRSMVSLLEANGITCDEVIPNGINTEQCSNQLNESETKELFSIDKPNAVITLAGRLTRDKGIFQALDALAELRSRGVNCSLQLLGGNRGQDRNFDSRVVATGLSRRVLYRGWLTGKQLAAAYQLSTVVLVPSIYLDNYPTVVLEAMSHGKPLVVTAFGGAREAVEQAGCGYVVSPFDITHMADYLEKLINDSDLAGRFGRAGQKAVRSWLHIDHATDRYLTIMEELIKTS